MARINVTNQLRGELAEVYFKHYSIFMGFAYARPEDVGWDLLHRDVIVFKLGYRRIHIKIPGQLSTILADIVRPSNRSAGSPSYPFDFITCRVRGDFEELGEDEVLREALSEFHVVEVKSGSSQLTTNEDALKQQCRSAGIDYVVYRISSIDDPVGYWDLTQDI